MTFSRSLRSRCPVCGEGRLFAKVSNIKQFRDLFLPLDHCEVCHFQFARQPGYYFGVLTPILPLLALFTGITLAGISYFGFHQEIDTVLAWGGLGIAIGFVAFFRTAIAIYIALDHAIDPPIESEKIKSALKFRPIDLDKNLAQAISFREDAAACSFGTSRPVWGEGGTSSKYVQYLKEKVQRDPMAAVHIWLNGQMIGQMEFDQSKKDASIGWVNLFYLVPEMRGKGLSNELDRHAIKYLRSKGYKVARLAVSPTNLRAIRYYKRLGWIDSDERSDNPDVRLMEKAIPPL